MTTVTLWETGNGSHVQIDCGSYPASACSIECAGFECTAVTLTCSFAPRALALFGAVVMPTCAPVFLIPSLDGVNRFRYIGIPGVAVHMERGRPAEADEIRASA